MTAANDQPLTQQTLTGLDPRVGRPGYDRSRITAGIVHFGVGGFHRAHQAMYTDAVLAEDGNEGWGICGVGVLPGDAAMKRVMDAQDCLYTLVLKEADGSLQARVIGSIVEYLLAPDDPEAVLARLSDPATRIVSLTVTEGGYNTSDVTGDFDRSNPSVVADAEAGAIPSTVFGFVVEALARRRAARIPAFTVASCDNLQGNGDIARSAFLAFAAMRDQELADWMQAEVAFPNSMVDRITPATTDEDRELVSREFGINDGWPVVCEPFVQWVAEDRFTDGRPPWQDAGVQLVEDVHPYELMKLRLLNASHQALAYFGSLAGYVYAHDAATDQDLRALVQAYMETEGSPTLSPVPGIDLQEYRQTLLERFANPGVKDTVARLAAESSDRIPKWLVPVIRAQLAADRPVRLSAAIVASWARYAEGVDEQGEPITVVDRLRDRVMAAANRYAEDELAFVRDTELFGDLAEDERFTQPYLQTLRSLHDVGASATLRGLMNG